ncbi:MAG: hypothetical protein ACYS21_01410 [Planctomycetota bacterium]
MKLCGRPLVLYIITSLGEPVSGIGGLGLNQDGALDFVDFALFDGCCVQPVEDK